MAKRSVTKEKKKRVWKRDSYKCTYCGQHLNETNRTVDHIIPLSYGGNNSIENLTSCCLNCNKKKMKKEQFIKLKNN